MKADDVDWAAQLVNALKCLPKMRKQISGKTKSKRYDGYTLEMSSAEMSDGQGQGSDGDAYFYLQGPLALKVLEVAESLMRDELKSLGVNL